MTGTRIDGLCKTWYQAGFALSYNHRTMDPERWRQVERLFQSALEHPPEERDAFLTQACGGDRDLRDEVESLLRQSSGTGLLDRPALELAGCTFGPYQLIERVGVGGMGEVFRAIDTRLNRTVALKLLHPDLAGRPGFRQRFEREARACSALNHPHICGVHDVGEQDGISYLVMEYVDGATLADRLEKGPLPFERVIEYGTEIADALATAHSLGIVHRDLKPGNVMVTETGVKVLDFGLAKFDRPKGREGLTTATLTGEAGLIGTLAYMSPEQLEGKASDARSDIFALGLVLHEMAAGTRAFTAQSQAGLIAEILRGEPAPLAGVPAQFARLVRRCLMRDPARRWQSASDVKLELQDSLSAPVEYPAPRWRLWVLAACFWAVSVLAAWWAGATVSHDSSAVDLSGYRLTPFASARHLQATPMWSPDGKKIAFVGQEDHRRALLVQSLRSSTALALTGPEVDVSPFFQGFWHPSSQFLYFTGTRNGHMGIFRVPAGGGEAELIQADALRGTISPDGRTMVTLAQTPSGFRIFTASPPESARRPYQPAAFEAGQWKGRPYVAFAPDGGELLAVVDTEQRREAWLLPWPPGKGRRVLEGAVFGPAPQFAWMPDSRHVVVSASPAGGHSQLYMADIENGRYWRVLVQDRPVTVPTVSPDGHSVAYESSLSTSEIIAAPLDGQPARTLLGGGSSQQMAHHSDTTGQLVYVTDRRGIPELWITDVAENWDRVLLSPGDIPTDSGPAAGFATPVFSPDGRRVAVVAISTAGDAIYTTPASAAMPVRATSEKNPSEYGPTWSPDGRWLAFWHIAGKETRLAKVRPGSGEPPMDLAACWNRTVPAWSPSGEWIAYHDPASQLALVSPDGQQRRILGGTGAVAWARDGKTLYQARSDTHRLVAIEVATGREKALRELGEMVPYSSSNAGWRASITPDGREFVYTVSHPREEIWILDGIGVARPWWRWR